MKKVLLILLVCIGACAFLSAGSSRWTSVVSAGAAPAIQKIIYNDEYHPDRITTGLKLSTSYMHQMNGTHSSLVFEFSFGQFPYSGFHHYCDLRASFGMRMPILYKENEAGKPSFGFFMRSNIGVSVDIRDDNDIGAYGFFSIGGVFLVEMDVVSVELNIDTSISYQHGSTVHELCPGLTVCFPIGGNGK